MTIFVFALLIGVIAGLRAMTPAAAVSWAARLGWLPLLGTPLQFLGSAWAPWMFSAFALVELVTDQLPKTPSRKVPVQFGARLVSGAFAGAAIGLAKGSLVVGLVAGIVGAVLGTYGGAAGRSALAKKLGKDLPAALIEDVIALGGGFAIVWAAAGA